MHPNIALNWCDIHECNYSIIIRNNLEYLKFTMSGCLVHFLSYSIIMTIIDVSTPCEALIFPFILSARHACIAFYIFPLLRHFLSKVCFSSRKRVFLSFIQSHYFY